MKHQPYISLKSVIQDYLVESEQGNDKEFKVFHSAYRGMEQLGLDAFYKVKTVKLLVNSNLTVTLPDDYVNWTKVGVHNSVGEIIPLYYNQKLSSYAALNADRISMVSDDELADSGDWGVSTWMNYRVDGGIVNVYGVPSGAPFVGNFKIDIDNGVLLLNEDFEYDYIILEYVSSPKQDEEYYLPVQFREALIAWLWWKDRRISSINRGMVGVGRDLRNDFYNERRLAIARWKPIRISEAYQSSQQQTRLSVKT